MRKPEGSSEQRRPMIGENSQCEEATHATKRLPQPWLHQLWAGCTRGCIKAGHVEIVEQDVSLLMSHGAVKDAGVTVDLASGRAQLQRLECDARPVIALTGHVGFQIRCLLRGRGGTVTWIGTGIRCPLEALRR